MKGFFPRDWRPTPPPPVGCCHSYALKLQASYQQVAMFIMHVTKLRENLSLYGVGPAQMYTVPFATI